MGLCAVSRDLSRYLDLIDERDQREMFVERCATDLSSAGSVYVRDELISADDIIAGADFEPLFGVLWELLSGSPEKARSMLQSVVYAEAEKKIERLLDQK